MYTNIAKGRNLDSIEKIKAIGLTDEHIFACL
jgi:hypothetical protein